MMPQNKPPGALPAHLAPANLQVLQERVNQEYGAFGQRTEEEAAEGDRRVLSDSWFKPTLKIVAAISAATLFLYFASHPDFSAPGEWSNKFRLDTAFIIFWGPLLYLTMFRQKLSKSVRTYLVVSLFVEAFSETMFFHYGGQREGGYWDTVMWPANVAWFGTIKEFAGVPGASLSIFTFVTIGLLYRAIKGPKPEGWTAPPKFAKNALYVFFGTVFALWVLGIARGGQIDGAFRQTVHLMQLPIVAMLFLYALRIPEDLAAIGTAFVVTAVVRSFLVMFVYFGICMPAGVTERPGQPEWCTNHSDTVLFVTALVILLTHALEQHSTKVTLRALGLGAIILFAIILNNRRLAFVSLAAAPLVIYLALRPSRRKRRVTAALAIGVPLLMGYVLIGSEINSNSAVLKPAKLVVSVLDQKDTSAVSRDIENENLIYTLRADPVVTKGWGHDYEYSPNNPPVDLSEVFKNYRLIAHNGVLWLWSIAGVFGFAAMWMVYPLTSTLAMRGYRAADSPLERSAALAALGTVCIVVIQIWGDQGFSSYMTLVTFGVAYAVAARLAVRAA
jgi:hypothetical protein